MTSHTPPRLRRRLRAPRMGADCPRSLRDPNQAAGDREERGGEEHRRSERGAQGLHSGHGGYPRGVFLVELETS